MIDNKLKISIALSGGGIRASLFHLGVLKYLADKDFLEKVTMISSVSGGSLLIGLIYSLNDNNWPSSEQFLNTVFPKSKIIITSIGLQEKALKSLLINPISLFLGKAKLISKCLEKYWGINGRLDQIPKSPRWTINSTTYETGKNWRFIPQKRMGDYKTNYVLDPKLKISNAISASAGYPGLIGPLTIYPNKFKWVSFKDINRIIKPTFKKIHLWDGGLYDNLGIESIFKSGKQVLRDETNFLIVSDASLGIEFQNRPFDFFRRSLRLIDIVMDQVRSLKARSVINFFQANLNSGVYLQIGNTAKYILQQAKYPITDIKKLENTTLNFANVRKAAEHKTDLNKVTIEQFDLLTRHGYEVAKYTCKGYISRDVIDN